MIPNPSEQFEAYVPVYDTVPESWEDAREFLVEHLKKISNAVNAREVGWFLDEELLSGKQFIPSASKPTGEMQQFRSVLRKVVDTGQLPAAAGALQVPHGITFDANFTLIQLFGAATSPAGAIRALPLPFVVANSATISQDQIQLYIDQTNINIVVGKDRSDFTRSFVVIEYLQEI